MELNIVPVKEKVLYKLNQAMSLLKNGRCKSGCTIKKYKHDNGFLHKENGPAYLVINNKGIVLTEEYWRDGELHRIGKPAVIKRNENGKITDQEFWEFGKKIR